MNETEFETLVRADLRKWQSAALRITGNYADTDDAVQSALVIAWNQRGDFSGEGQFSTFVYGIVVHKALDLVRSDAARHRRERNYKAPAPRPHQSALYEGIARLPEIYAQTVVALLENEMKYAGAARMLGWPEKLLYSRMHRAKTLLAKILSEKPKPLPKPKTASDAKV